MELRDIEQSGLAIRNNTESILDPVFYWQLISNNAIMGIRYKAFTYKDKPINNINELISLCRQNDFKCILEDINNVRL